MTTRRKRVIAGIAAVVVLGGIVAYNVKARRGGQVAVQSQKAGRRDLVSVVSASGEIKPKRYVNISANVSGRIEQLLVKEGETVKKGQVLARIDSTRIAAGERQSAAALEGAKADLARAEADVDVSRLAFERQKRMHAEKLISMAWRSSCSWNALPSREPAPSSSRSAAIWATPGLSAGSSSAPPRNAKSMAISGAP